MDQAQINKYAFDIHLNNVKVGWWDNQNECIYQKIQLASTEVAEATEGARKDLMDDHLPHRKMAEVELADVLIRVLDIGGKLNLRFNGQQNAHWYCEPSNSIGMQHLGINNSLILMARSYEIFQDGKSDNIALVVAYSDCIAAINRVSENQDYDLEAAMIEKLAYNAQRADHKKENRAKDGGKKF